MQMKQDSLGMTYMEIKYGMGCGVVHAAILKALSKRYNITHVAG